MAAPAPKRVLDEAVEERVAKRARDGDAKLVYPWRYAVPLSASYDELANMKPITKGFPFGETDDAHMSLTELDTDERWPYYYPRDRVYSNVNVDEKSNHGTHRIIYKFTRLMLSTQRLFLQCYAPNNRALLALFFAHFDANQKISATDESSLSLDSYCRNGYGTIRAMVHRYSKLDTIDTLDAFHQQRDAVFHGAAQRPATFRERTPAEQGAMNHAFYMYTALRFYSSVFFPSPTRLAVPLPRGLILFEGRSGTTADTRALKSTIRREVFSTTWHPNVAIQYLGGVEKSGFDESFAGAAEHRGTVFFVHKVMSDGILGVDAQGEPRRHARERNKWNPELYEECEIVVQPFVKIHLFEECILLIQHNPIDTVIHGDQTGGRHDVTPVYMRTIFTHLYLGDKCSCGHTG